MNNDDTHDDPDTSREVWQVLIGAAWTLLFVIGMIVSLYFFLKAVV